MALRALLLSPDDQAVHAINSVLEEMSVGCDRPLDGATAAKKLNSERFDLVLVDCENLPAAKLIFDVCRRSHGGVSVPVAIVDGRGGLPTAFRLGAELILTKPVAMDQARGTIRTAVSRTKKEQPAQDAKAGEAASAIATAEEKPQESTAPKALAAAAGAASGAAQTTLAIAATVPGEAASPANPETPVTAVATETIAPAMSSAAAAIAAAAPAVASEPVVSPVARTSSSEKQTVSVASTLAPSPERQLPEDPVMAALEADEPTQPSSTFSAFEAPRPERSRRLLVATLLLALAGGTGYAGWMYQTGFRKFIELRTEQGKTLLGLASRRAAVTVRRTTPVVPVKPPVQQAAPPPAAISLPQKSAEGAVPATSATNSPEKTISSNDSSKPSVSPETALKSSKTIEPEKKIAVAAAPASDFPAAKNAVILSSKGAEKRLLHRVAAVASAGASAQSSEATVVLKALIDEKGGVESLQPVEGNDALTEAAMKAVKQWRYKPYMRDGKAVPFQTIVLVDFQ